MSETRRVVTQPDHIPGAQESKRVYFQIPADKGQLAIRGPPTILWPTCDLDSEELTKVNGRDGADEREAAVGSHLARATIKHDPPVRANGGESTCQRDYGDKPIHPSHRPNGTDWGMAGSIWKYHKTHDGAQKPYK